LRSRLLETHKNVYGLSAIYLVIVWMLYPICWAFSEGANVLTVDHEMIFYGILDIFAGPLFLFLLLASLRDVDYDGFGLQSGKASDYVNVPPPAEKPREPLRETHLEPQAQAGAAV
jgi:bacteriorhodopsin